MMEVWLVRHAPVAASGICYGQSDIPCTLDPAEAATRIAAAAPVRFSELWASPWARTRDVAEQLAARWRISLRIDPRLSELSMGAFEGRPFTQLKCEPAFREWMRSWRTAAPPGGETLGQLSARASAWLDERKGAGSLLAITHAGVIRSLRAHVCGLSWDKAMCIPVEHLMPECLRQPAQSSFSNR